MIFKKKKHINPLEYELHIQILSMLYLQATFKGWMDIMYAAVDSVNVSIGKQHQTLQF